MSEIISTTDAPGPAGAYSQGVLRDGVLYTAGVVGKNPATGEVPGELEDEIRQALANLDAILTAGGASRASVVKTLCFLTDASTFARFDAVYADFFGDARPARSTVTVGLVPPHRFEIEAVAAVA